MSISVTNPFFQLQKKLKRQNWVKSLQFSHDTLRIVIEAIKAGQLTHYTIVGEKGM